ncbi:hypothetical protein CGLO_18423 [Colletotrichum gloeosporioides Cg-14]|uniref:Uncharacterized protein n=1 Tax=Colletotrichum gloeosporioides (strain Cg-14) TaxID=1237896 RepID=T0JI44_COLGC|nr:hypothetical protein CGLO_18423 [Colletotrichum gloeosporioides Cg-14]
MLIPSFCYY